jgi:molecular chaperone HtpG
MKTRRIKNSFETIVPKQTYTVQLEAMDSLAPFIITQPEFMRRMKEMNQSGGGGMFEWETCLTCTII